MRRACRQVGANTARRYFGLLLASVLWLYAPARLQASEAAGRRVLLIEQDRDPFLERVGAEIEKLGFTLVRSATQGPLEAAARGQLAVAALRVLPTRTGIEVWMADATSGRSLLRQVIVDESPAGPDLELIVLQTAELLRTSLLGEKAPPEPPTQVDAAQPKQTEQTEQTGAAARSRNTALQLWCGALYSPGGVGAALELGVSLQHFFGERWGLGLDLGLPLLPGTIKDAEGSAKLGAYFAGVLALARFQLGAGRFFATVGVGAAPLLVRYQGETQAPFQSKTGTQLTGAIYLRGDVGIIATRWLRFGVRGLAGAIFPRVSVTFAGNDTGSFGPALFAGFGFAEVSFP
jgi:hypothetical protein